MALIAHITTADGKPRKLRIGTDDEAKARSTIAHTQPAGVKIVRFEAEGEVAAVTSKLSDAIPTFQAERAAKKAAKE
jgi:hypothetical protein